MSNARVTYSRPVFVTVLVALSWRFLLVLEAGRNEALPGWRYFERSGSCPKALLSITEETEASQSLWRGS